MDKEQVYTFIRKIVVNGLTEGLSTESINSSIDLAINNLLEQKAINSTTVDIIKKLQGHISKMTDGVSFDETLRTITISSSNSQNCIENNTVNGITLADHCGRAKLTDECGKSRILPIPSSGVTISDECGKIRVTDECGHSRVLSKDYVSRKDSNWFNSGC
jgi:hypothetical protein